MSYWSYWGKTDRPPRDKGTVEAIHPIACHLMDVAAVARTLFQLNPHYQYFFQKGSGLDIPTLTNLVTWAGFSHDYGKFSFYFTDILPDIMRRLGHRPFNLKGKNSYYHTRLGVVLWAQHLRKHLIATGRFESHCETDKLIQGVFGHHGTPESQSEISKLSLVTLFRRSLQDVTDLAGDLHDNLLPGGKLIIPEMTPAQTANLSHYLGGILILADWVGSDPFYFPPAVPQDEDGSFNPNLSLVDYWEKVSLPQADKAVREAGLKFSRPKPHKDFRTLFPTFDGQPTVPTPAQDYLSHVPVNPEGGLYFFEDLMGSGKSEGLISLANYLMTHGPWRSFAWDLPTRSTADSLEGRTRQSGVLGRMFDWEGKLSFAVAHGKGHHRLKDALEPDIGSEWLDTRAKQAVMAQFSVGTLDQHLLGSMATKHRALRMVTLLGRILVIEEVQAYDPYTLEILLALVTWCALNGSPVIVATATLTDSVKKDLAETYCRVVRERLLQRDGEVSGWDDPEFTQSSYPLVTSITGSVVEQPVGSSSVPRKIKTRYETKKWKVCQELLDKAKEGLCVCWIKTTVDGSIRLYQRLRRLAVEQGFDPGNICLLHSRFSDTHRHQIEQKVECWFGKNSKTQDRKGKVLVATQIIEQSLNLDFDWMVSDVAPISALLQRLGRLQRHFRGIRIDPEFVVVGPRPTSRSTAKWLHRYDAKMNKIYPRTGMVWRAALEVINRPEWVLPTDMRDLLREGSSRDDMPLSLMEKEEYQDGLEKEARNRARNLSANLKAGYTIGATKVKNPPSGADRSVRMFGVHFDMYLALFDKDNQEVVPLDGTWDASKVSLYWGPINEKNHPVWTDAHRHYTRTWKTDPSTLEIMVLEVHQKRSDGVIVWVGKIKQGDRVRRVLYDETTGLRVTT